MNIYICKIQISLEGLIIGSNQTNNVSFVTSEVHALPNGIVDVDRLHPNIVAN